MGRLVRFFSLHLSYRLLYDAFYAPLSFRMFLSVKRVLASVFIWMVRRICFFLLVLHCFSKSVSWFHFPSKQGGGPAGFGKSVRSQSGFRYTDIFSRVYGFMSEDCLQRCRILFANQTGFDTTRTQAAPRFNPILFPMTFSFICFRDVICDNDVPTVNVGFFQLCSHTS